MDHGSAGRLLRQTTISSLQIQKLTVIEGRGHFRYSGDRPVRGGQSNKIRRSREQQILGSQLTDMESK